MAETLRVRANNLATNLAVLRTLQSRKEVQDQRTKEELEALFRKINADCARKAAKNEKAQKTAQYGPLPGFPSGKWWGIRMDCSRDCVHEPFNENVHHGPIGAVSICTSHLNTYNDVDVGNALTFTGQEYSASDISKDSLILSHKNRVPVRLVRSYCLSNDYAPKTGYRYDGLYIVVDHWLTISNNSKYHKYALVRLLNQDSPVWAEKISRFSNIFSSKKSLSPRLTRSFKKASPQKKSKASKFVYSKIEEEPKEVANVSAIVSRQVFKKIIPGSPNSSPKSASSTDSSSFYPNSCAKNACNINLSIRTNLYNSSCNSQDNKKTSNFTFKSTPYHKSNLVNCSQKNRLEAEKTGTDTSDTEGTDKTPSLSYCSSADESTEKKVKRVTWADSCDSPLGSLETSFPIVGNGFSYNSNSLSPSELSSSPTPSMKTFQHVAQIHASASPSPPPSKVNNNNNNNKITSSNKDKMCSSDEESMSIDSLAPDKLVSIIVKEKYHPMAKLLIGNMIGLENGESEILGAYNTLISKSTQEDSKMPSKEKTKLRNKFYLRNKTRKNGVLKKQRREIANLMIDAKFDPVTRGSRNRRLRSPKKRALSKSEMSQRKLVNGRRIPPRNNVNKDMRNSKEMRSTSREMQPKKIEKRKNEETSVATPKRPRMVSSGVQCTLLVQPSVDQAVQYSDASTEDNRGYVDEDVKSEPRSIGDEALCEPEPRSYANFSGSAFAAVNTVDSGIRIARLRSIGFKPITSPPVEEEDSTQSSQEYDRPEVDEEYNKYTSEETNEVAYMDDELHFEDIEDEVTVTNAKKVCEKKQKEDYRNLPPKPTESLVEKDFDAPWHGWKQVQANGQSYWIGY